MNDKILRAIETMKKGYALDPFRIVADYRKETAEICGYHGRELLELLQNAVDELGGTDDRSVAIVLKDNVLAINNNGNVFTYEGFISLMYSNLSPKHNNSEYIGNKGTGFRSVLNWADCIRIYSGDLSVEFSKSYAQEALLELRESANVAEFCKAHDDVQLATLVAPQLINPLKNKEYDTVIEIRLKADVVDKVISQLQQINSKTLLFLEKLEKLNIECNGEYYTYIKTLFEHANSTKDIHIIAKRNGETVGVDDWTILSREGNFEKQKYSVMVAYKEDMSVEPDVLYSYFKTKVDFPIHALVHATFDLNADRNYLIETEANEHILKVICETLVELALLTTVESVNYAPLTLLSTIKEFPNDLSWDNFSFNHYYLDAIARSNVFPTINSTYISFTENPKFYNSNIADLLSGVAFPTLMPPTENISIRTMLKAIAKYKKADLRYSYNEIAAGINVVLASLQIKERAALWLAFINEYRHDILPENKPHFVLDNHGNFVTDNQQVFLPAENVEIYSPPNFTEIVFMNKDLVNALRDLQGKENTLRGLASELSKFNVREYNLANIINVIVSRLKNRAHQTSKKTQGCYEETIEWLWKLWQSNVLKGEMPALTLIPLINRKGEVKSANELYIGKEFGNVITENLFNDRDDLFVSMPRRITLTESTKPQYKEFLFALGVVQFPRKTKEKIYLVPQAYKELIYRSIKKYPLLAEDNRYNNEQEFRSSNLASVEVATVEHLTEILEHANTKSIIDWIRHDDRLNSLLSNYEPSTSRASVINLYQQKGRTISGEQLASYLYFKFATSKWIEVEGIRYSPTQCLLVSKVGTLFSPIVVAPNLDLFIDNNNRKISETNIVQAILERIGVASDYSELDTGTLYSLLITIPEVDLTGEISKALYTSILKSGGLRNFNPSNESYRKFLTKGKVYCKSSKTYIATEDSHYLSEKTVSREVLKDFNLIAIPSRQSQENIKQYFGVAPLKIKGTIVGEPTIHPASVAFEQDFNDFICYAFCTRVDNAKNGEISMVKTLKVRLCTYIQADYGKGKIELAENSYIRGKNYVYVRAPKNSENLRQLKSNVDFCSTIAELFVTAIGIQDDTLFGYVRSLYEKAAHNRNALILHDYDDLNILERSRDALNRTQSEKEMFLTACTLITGASGVTSIKAEIDSINFSDFNSTANSRSLIDILHKLNIDVDDFNEKSEVMVNLIPFYFECLQKQVNDNSNLYKNGLFVLLKNRPLSEQQKFLNKLNEYTVCVFNPQNSIHYDWNADFTERFGSILSFASDEDANTAWRINRDIFLQGKDMSIVDDLLVNDSLESLLYFGNFNELDTAYSAKKKDIDFAKAQESIVLNSTPTTPIPIISIAVAAPPSNIRSTTHTGSRMAGMKRERNISDWGAYAEKIVYEQMKSTFRNVVWVSENAKKFGVNPDGIGGLGYDLKYTSETGEPVYVEIKSTAGTGISFVITENELNFAEAHPQQFEIILVTALMNDADRKIYKLAGLFDYAAGEDRFCNQKFSITGDNYTIRCQVDLEGENI